MKKARPAPGPHDGELDRSVRLFISYSHLNYVWMKPLKVFLEGFQYDDRRENWKIQYLHAWHDKELTKGDPSDPEIKYELARMDIFVPLVSPEFFSSWYIQNVELPLAKKRHKQNRILVVPIILYDINLREKCEFLHQFPPLPMSGQWWNKYADINDAYRMIDDGLWESIRTAANRKGGGDPPRP